MKKLLVLVICLSLSPSFCQEIIEESAQKLINDKTYFHNYKIEKFHLHTNKTTYYSGEKIWFKIYVVDDDDNKPSIETSNLHVNLYNSQNVLISNNLFYVIDGTTFGEIELDKDLKAGDYYIELDTQWNRNFKKGTIFKIRILALKEKNTSQLLINELVKEFAITFYPESNTILENMYNTIYYSVHNDNLKQIEIKIVDDKTRNTITTFKTNESGIGFFNLFYNSTFTAVYEINDVEHKVKLPIFDKKGVIIHKKMVTRTPNVLALELKTNKATLSDLNNEFVYVVLHRNGSLRSIAPLQLRKGITNYTINFLKESLFNGINTITVFNKENKPIGNRYFFSNKNKNLNLKITKDQIVNDSLLLNFNLLNNSATANISVSVLPEETKVYNNTSNILTSFLVSPYIKSPSNKITQHINDKFSRDEYIDAIIQTLTRESAFSYKDLANSRLLFNNDNGITIKGSINTKIKDLSGYKVMLSSQENNLLLMSPIDNKEFIFQNLLLYHPSNYKLALISETGDIKQASFFVYNVLKKYKSNFNIENVKHSVNNAKLNSDLSQNEDSLNNPFPNYKNVEQLNEVVITTYRDKVKHKTDSIIYGDSFLKLLNTGFSQNYLIDEAVSEALDIIDFLTRLQGIKVVFGSLGNVSIQNRRGPTTFSGSQTMNVFLDGVSLNDDLSILIGLSARDFELVTVNSSGAGLGLAGSGGVINLQSKKKNSTKRNNKSIIKESETEFGFSKPSLQYVNPELEFQSQISRNYYETIDWIPNFSVIPRIDNYLKINVSNFKNIKLIINGFNENGDLFFDEIPLTTKENN